MLRVIEELIAQFFESMDGCLHIETLQVLTGTISCLQALLPQLLEHPSPRSHPPDLFLHLRHRAYSVSTPRENDLALKDQGRWLVEAEALVP